MKVFLVLYMDAEKNWLKAVSFHSVLLWCKIAKKKGNVVLCSGLFTFI